MAPPDPSRTLYLVDGTNNLFRAYFAIQRLRSSQGAPTNAVFGFTNMLRKLIKEQDPRYLAVAFDRPEPTFRHKAYADYKAQRPEAPPDLIAQIPLVKQVCAVLGAPLVELPGYEADDIIGTLAHRAVAAGFRVIIVGTDKDLLQLVGPAVVVLNPVSGEILDADGVERTFGVRPEHVVDVLALQGDASDNIPGVPGIGEVGARNLVRKYGDLESVLAHADQVSGKKTREGLEGHADTARLSRDLATVRLDVPVEFDAETLRLRPPDAAAAGALFTELEFSALAREFATPAGGMTQARCTLVRDVGRLREIAVRLAGATSAIHIETDGAPPMHATPIGIALADAGGEAFYVPLAHRGLSAAPQPDGAAVIEALRPLLEPQGVARAAHGAKEALVLLGRMGSEIAGFAADTQVASYLLNPERRGHDLDVVAREMAGLTLPSYESVLGGGARRAAMADLDTGRAAVLLGTRVAAVALLAGRLEVALRDAGLLEMYRGTEVPLAAVLASMERTGVRIDTRFLASLSTAWSATLDRLTSEIHALAGKPFNINSPRQLGEVLFEVLKLKPKRRTARTRSFSTDAATLEELATEHELPRRLLEYRALQKLQSTYVDALPGLIHPGTGRVHTSFNQAVAATGRLSSSDPNLQNIPVRTEQGRQIRRAFIPADGFLLLSADYSQIELRILAHLCGDPALLGAFRAGEDIHRRTAAEVFGVLPDLVSPEMRRRAKAVNFGILYGMGPRRLAREQGIPPKEAQAFIERYFERLPRVKEYLDAAIAAAEARGQVRTLFNRVRYFPEIQGTDRNARQQAVRAAVNTALQGTAADLIKMAMVELDAHLRAGRAGARMILQVHDELVLEVPEGALDGVATLVRRIMEGIWTLEVPLVVDLRAGPNWLEMSDLSRSRD